MAFERSKANHYPYQQQPHTSFLSRERFNNTILLYSREPVGY